MKIEVIRTDGTRAEYTFKGPLHSFKDLYSLVNCDTFCTVNLRDGRVMLADDNGYEIGPVIDHGMVEGPMGPTRYIEHKPGPARKPVNVEATKLYHAVCRPGTTHQIVGDVIIIRDEDLAR